MSQQGQIIGERKPPPTPRDIERNQPDNTRERDVDDTILDRWRKERPSKFRGGANALEAEQWIQHIEHVFSFLRPRAEDKVRLVIRQLEGNALEWWKGISFGRNLENVTWEDFVDLFTREYFPETVRWEKRTELDTLQQGGQNNFRVQNRISESSSVRTRDNDK